MGGVAVFFFFFRGIASLSLLWVEVLFLPFQLGGAAWFPLSLGGVAFLFSPLRLGGAAWSTPVAFPLSSLGSCFVGL